MMRRVRAGSRTGGARVPAAVAIGVVVLAGLTAGCGSGTAGLTGPGGPPGVATPSPDDAKPDGGPASASASPTGPGPGTGAGQGTGTPEAAPSASPSPRPRTLMSEGDRSGRVRELQARLRQTGHFDRRPTGYYGTATAASVRSFQGERGLPRTGRTDTVTWRRLLTTTRKPTANELDPPTERPVAAPDARCMTGRVLCISKNSRTLSWMIEGRVVSSMDVRFGSRYTPTREGAFSVYWKSRHHVSTLYDTPMPYAMFFSGGQAVHYSPDFAARGYSGASHGCVNVRDEGRVAALFDQVRTGDKVVVYW